MVRLRKTQSKLKTIKNPLVDEYRQYLEDRSIDYHIEVRRESEQARLSLRSKARSAALKKIPDADSAIVVTHSQRKNLVDDRPITNLLAGLEQI